MTAIIREASKAEVERVVFDLNHYSAEQLAFFRECIKATTGLWTGFIADELVCFWGVMPPSLISDSAYLWLYTTERLLGNEFLFVRYSQMAIEKILAEYPVIRGHASADNTRGIRWLRWLGATFGDPQGLLIPFTIRRRHG